MMDEYKPSSPNAVSRAIQDQFSDFLSVKNFGAVGDGVANDAPAIQAACTASALTGRGLRFPQGSYLLLSAITINGKIALHGESRSNTKLIWGAGSAGEGVTINLNGSAGISDMAEVRDLQFLSANTNATETALRVIGSASYSADRITSRVVIRDVVIRGLNHPLTNGWGNGIVLTNCSCALVDCLTFWGKVGAGEPNYDSVAAITYDNANGSVPHPTAFTITNSFICYAKTGIYADDFEGGMIRGNQIIGVNFGVSVKGPLEFPHISILDNHLNVSDACVIVDRMNEAIITGNLLYTTFKESLSGTGISIINGASFFSIQNNTFENMKTTIGMNGVLVNSGSSGLIANNLFRRSNGFTSGNGAAIWLAAGASDVTVGLNKYTNTETPVIDSGTGNVVAGGGVNWAALSTGTTSQFDSQALSLDTNGDGVITLPKPYKTTHKTAIACNGNPNFAAGNLAFSAGSLTLTSFKVSVRPNPGAIAVQVNWQSYGN